MKTSAISSVVWMASGKYVATSCVAQMASGIYIATTYFSTDFNSTILYAWLLSLTTTKYVFILTVPALGASGL